MADVSHLGQFLPICSALCQSFQSMLSRILLEVFLELSVGSSVTDTCKQGPCHLTNRSTNHALSPFLFSSLSSSSSPPRPLPIIRVLLGLSSMYFLVCVHPLRRGYWLQTVRLQGGQGCELRVLLPRQLLLAAEQPPMRRSVNRFIRCCLILKAEWILPA